MTFAARARAEVGIAHVLEGRHLVGLAAEGDPEELVLPRHKRTVCESHDAILRSDSDTMQAVRATVSPSYARQGRAVRELPSSCPAGQPPE
jgi:hypothetical protein